MDKLENERTDLRMKEEQGRSLTPSNRRFVQSVLQRLIGKQRFEKLKETSIYRFLVEAFTMNLFSLAITAPNELLIAGMDIDEFIRTRLAAMVINTITGRPYGVWRD